MGNIGDEAVLAGLVASFTEACPKAELVVLSAEPADTLALHGVKAVGRMAPGDVIAALRGSKLLVSGGGSLLQDVTSTRSLGYYLGLIWLAKKFDKKVMVYAQGIGPINGRTARSAARSVLNTVDLITVRDEGSKAYLEELGVTRPPVHVTADPSFAMQPTEDGVVDEILRASGVPEGVPLIGVSLRPWRDQVRWMPEITRGLDAAAAQIGGALVFLPMQREQDFGISVQVASQMTAPAVVVASRMSPPQMLAACSKMDMLVGMRLHALIFSATMGVPFVSISYDPKIDAFVSAVDQEEPLTIDWLTANDVTSRVINVWERREELSESVKRCIAPMRAKAMKNAELACELI